MVLELLEIDGLRQMGVEAGFLGALDVFLHAETGERDGGRLPGFSYLPDQVDAGAIGQTQVAEIKIDGLPIIILPVITTSCAGSPPQSLGEDAQAETA